MLGQRLQYERQCLIGKQKAMQNCLSSSIGKQQRSVKMLPGSDGTMARAKAFLSSIADASAAL